MEPIQEICNKSSDIKHAKYYDFYNTQKYNKVKDTEYWGIGIENETYLMLNELKEIPKSFVIYNHKRERYSVDYWNNYKVDELFDTLDKLPETIMIPTYINAYHFQKTNIAGEHEYLYVKGKIPNPKFSGVTIDNFLRNKSQVFRRLFKKNMTYDGDTFEFITSNFYKTNVNTVLSELISIKKLFITEINDQGIFNEKVVFPKQNHGLVKFTTNPKNIGICNNGTYHINITLPTAIDSTGKIIDIIKFKNIHANAIRAIQWIEPLLIGIYGTPDIFNLLNPAYNGGSQRLGLSRYIGLGTYDTKTMIRGKLLDTFDYKETGTYFNDLHQNSPYIPPNKIGYDINFNKFKKHGIELRILDWFPEEYLQSVMNLIILVCQHSILAEIPDPRNDPDWNELAMNCIKKGTHATIKPRLYNKYYRVFGKKPRNWLPRIYDKHILQIIIKLADHLYKKYNDYPICKKMSPDMPPIKIITYNSIARFNHKNTLNKKDPNCVI